MPGFAVPGWMAIVIIVMAVSAAVRISGRGGSRRKMRWQESDDLERRLADLEESHRQRAAGSGDAAELQRRIGELEERLDFAERMLAKQADAVRLGPPKA